jgi:hypothetical protein
VRGGPWRYSRYSFRLFLITQDGVREIGTEIDFTDARRGNEQQQPPVRRALLGAGHRTRRHRLRPGTRPHQRTGREHSRQGRRHPPTGTGRKAQEIAEINLNAAGFIHTFRLLEGIAADGKGWIERNDPNNLPSLHAAD